MNERLLVKGRVVLKHIRNGKEIDRRDIANLIVNTGLEHIAKLINGVETTHFTYAQVGTGTSAVIATNTALEIYNAELDTAESYEASYKAKFVGTIHFTSTVAVTESGIFNGVQAGSPVMLCRQVFTVLNVEAGDSIELTWNVTISTT